MGRYDICLDREYNIDTDDENVIGTIIKSYQPNQKPVYIINCQCLMLLNSPHNTLERAKEYVEAMLLAKVMGRYN
tara:strand:+ start:779 stop:1003 length:225 start_codon:yes stop_codon:yes gene_type:complete